MTEDTKKIGLVVLVVIGIAAAVWSGVRSMRGPVAPPPESAAAAQREKMQQLLKGGGTGAPVRPRGPQGPGAAAASTGAPAAR
jgi:hypothetical protein